MKVSDYKELIAYQKSYQLVKDIYKITADFPKNEIYGIVSQLRRAAVSVPSNIAEGYMRGSKEYIHFLKIALGSSAEVETLLSLSRDLGFCNVAEAARIGEVNLEVRKLLLRYLKKLTSE